MNAVISPASMSVATPATHKSGSGHTSVYGRSNSSHTSSYTTSRNASANISTSTPVVNSVKSLRSSPVLSNTSISDTPLSNTAPVSSASSIQPVNASYSLKSGPMNIAAVLQKTSVSNSGSSNASAQVSAQSTHFQTSTVQANTVQSPTNYKTTESQQATPFQPVVFTDVNDQPSTVNRFISTTEPQSETPANGQAMTSNVTSTTDANVTSNDAEVEQAANEQSQQESAAAKEQINKQIAQKQQQIDQAEAQQISELSKRDIEVKTHEQAHAAVGGSFAQSPSYEYEKGPDGRRYAVDGEVSIDVAPISGDPQATLSKMQKVYAAAMAPVQPSMADIRVAAQAVQYMNEAKQALVVERQQSVMSTQDSEHMTELGQIFKQPDNRDPLAPFMQKQSNSDNTIAASATPYTSSAEPLNSQSIASKPIVNATLTASQTSSSVTSRGADIQSMSANGINQQLNSASRYNPYQNQLLHQTSSQAQPPGFEFYV
ncbi:putative metalloprotease CJM1_0395 family protein [Shewanella sp. MF05960]|uniref:putative metalloprotease CJM1_0395 family protein n=1 Tax=Shewanella sp. MF05960 TaxID=3434874 RepID=UPI003D7B5BDD